MRQLARRFGGTLLALLAVYLAAGTIGGLVPSSQKLAAGEAPQSVLLLPGPIHTDLLLPLTPDVRARFAPLERDGVPVLDPRAEWLIVGWGAREFYTRTKAWHDLRPGPIWRAVTGDKAVIRVDVLGALPADHGLTVVALGDQQMAGLVERIAGEIGPVLPVPGYGSTDRFYAAPGRFSAFRTCNVWVGDVLREIGVPVGIWTPFTWTLP